MSFHFLKRMKIFAIGLSILFVSVSPVLSILSYACAVTGASAYQPLYSQVQQAIQNAASNSSGTDTPLSSLKVGYPTYSYDSTPSIPPVILEGIAAQESGWKQATGSVARGSTGPALVSSGCGYGVMQITSGMINPGDLPIAQQQKIASDYAYNIAYGAKMLSDKWNYAGAVMGNRDPNKIENWYFAVWAYNIRSWKNNPWNGNYPWPRPTYNWKGGSYPAYDYPYQEIIWGYAANPLTDGNGTPLWSPVNLTLPDRNAIGNYTTWGTDYKNPDHINDVSPIHLNGGPGFIVSTTSLSFLAIAGGSAATPSSEKIGLSGQLGAGSGWKATLSGDINWLGLDHAVGSSVPDQITTNVTYLPSPGLHEGTLTIDGGSISGSPTIVHVSLYVSSGGSIRSNYVPVIEKQYSGGW